MTSVKLNETTKATKKDIINNIHRITKTQFDWMVKSKNANNRMFMNRYFEAYSTMLLLSLSCGLIDNEEYEKASNDAINILCD